MIQYFSYRELYVHGGFQPLDYHFKKNFNGLDFTYKLSIASGSSVDGRHLGCIEVDTGDSAQDQKIVDSILRSFPCDKETAEDAKDKIERWTTLTPSNLAIVNGKVEITPDP